jgi:hypothetical protein
MRADYAALIVGIALAMLLLGYWVARLTVLREVRNEQPAAVDFTELQRAFAELPAVPRMTTREFGIAAPMNYDALRAELENDPQNMGYHALGQDYAAIAALLNKRQTRLIANPEPQQRIFKPLTMSGFMDLLTSDEALKVYGIGTLKASIERAARRDDRAELAGIVRSVHGMFSPETQTRIRDWLLATELDPAWTTKVVVVDPSRAWQLNLPEAQATDIQQVL